MGGEGEGPQGRTSAAGGSEERPGGRAQEAPGPLQGAGQEPGELIPLLLPSLEFKLHPECHEPVLVKMGGQPGLG